MKRPSNFFLAIIFSLVLMLFSLSVARTDDKFICIFEGSIAAGVESLEDGGGTQSGLVIRGWPWQVLEVRGCGTNYRPIDSTMSASAETSINLTGLALNYLLAFGLSYAGLTLLAQRKKP